MVNNDINRDPQVIKKYWSGNTRVWWDFFWCFSLAALSSISREQCIIFPQVLGEALSYFMILFFWSWNKSHVKSKFARYFIHFVCWFFFIICSFMIISLFCGLRFELHGYGVLLLIAILGLVVRKYIRLMFIA